MPGEEQAVQVVLGFAALAPTYCQSTAARACWMAAPDPCLVAPVSRHRLPCLSGLAQLQQQQEHQQGQQRVSQDGVGSSEGTALVATAAARGGGEAADGSGRPHSTAGNHRLQHGRDGSSSSTLG